MDLRAGAARRWKEEVANVAGRILERARRMGINVSDAEPTASVPLDGGPVCATCNNQRYIISQTGIIQCPACGVAAGWAAKSLDSYSSATGRAREQTFENFKIEIDGQIDTGLQLCRDAATAFADTLDGWIVFHGSYGNGKSHLCAAAANRLHERRKACIFISMPDLTKSLKDLMDDDFARSVNQTYGQRLSKYQAAPVLILDDIHAEKISDWSEGVLFEIVDYRYRNRLPTIFATNLDPLDKGEFDPRIISRWSDAELSIIIANNAPDYRQRSVEER